MKPLIFLLLVLFCFENNFSQNKNQHQNKVTTSNSYQYLNANQWKYWISNMGPAAVNPDLNNPGALWPGGGQNLFQNLISSNGLFWGGKIGGKIFITRMGRIFDPYLQAGRIFDDGTASDPKDERFRIFKIMKAWESIPIGTERDMLEKDYNEWPVEDGAPWVDMDGDGIFARGIDQPAFPGDEVLWCISNDLDTTIIPWQNFIPGGGFPYDVPIPVGIEVQTTAYSFMRTGDLGDLVIINYRLINKSGKNITEMYLGYSSDVILGETNDSFIGVDTSLNLAYGYDRDNQSQYYSIPLL